MKSFLSAVLAVAMVASTASAQQAPRQPRPPNIGAPRGSDAGQGPACDQLTVYGAVQPPGPAATTYGPGIPLAAPPNPPLLMSGGGGGGGGGAAAAAPAATPPAAPAAAPAGGGNVPLGAAGMAMRGTVIPTAPKLPFHNVEPPQPPTGTAGFSNVNGVVLLKNGDLVVNQRLSMFQTLEYDSQNRLIRNINPNMISRPHGFRIDAQDNLWITDQQCGIVVKMSPTGQVLMTLGTKGKSGTWNEAKGERFLNQPTDLAFAPNGDIYVSTGHGPNEAARVTRFDKTGKYITSWSMAHADGSQAVIHTIAIRPTNGEVWVADREQKKLKVFDANGKALREIQMQNLPCGLYVDPKGQLWMTTGMDGMVLRLDWDGKILGYIGQSGFGKDDFGEAHYMTMTPDGKTIWVGDTVNNDIKKFVAN